MKTVTRRDLLASLGAVGGSSLLTGCGGAAPDGSAASAA